MFACVSLTALLGLGTKRRGTTCWLLCGCLICITCTYARQMTGPQSRASRCPRKVKVKAFRTVFIFTQAGLERWRKNKSAWEQCQRYWPSSLAQVGPPINSCWMCERAPLSTWSSSVGSQAAQSTLKAASMYYYPLQGTIASRGLRTNSNEWASECPQRQVGEMCWRVQSISRVRCGKWPWAWA